jgi:hypothetical protein
LTDLHGILDRVTVFGLAPIALGLGTVASEICHALMGIPLVMPLATVCSRGERDLGPDAWHRRVEVAVGGLLVAGPLVAGGALGTSGQLFHTVGLVVLAVTLARGSVRGPGDDPT